MKGKDVMRAAMWMLTVMLAFGPLLEAAESGRNPNIILQEALYQEQTAGDLDKAIELYAQVREQAAEVERLAARATYQLGMCHLKKGETEKAIEYFEEVVGYYPLQTSLVERAQAQLDKLVPEKPINVLFDQATQAVWMAVSSMYGQICTEAGKENLYTNSNIHFVNSDFESWYGGYGFYYNTSNETVSGRIQIGGTTYPNQTLYDVMGNPLETEIVPSGKRENHYDIYLNLPQALAPGDFFPYAWALDETKTLQQPPFSSEGNYTLKMENRFGQRALEVFFLVAPNEIAVEYEEAFVTIRDSEGAVVDAGETTDRQTVGDYTIYAWTREVQTDETHVVTVSLSKQKILSPEEIAKIVEKAVLTISTCAETDPRVKESMDSLQEIPEEKLVTKLAAYLDSDTATIRRSAIYILWKGGFSDISAAASKLIELCGHEENYTRGMAALALGGGHAASAYDALVEMTLNDTDSFARRCGAYALGLLGNPKAIPILQQALEDTDDTVKGNAQAAITMLTKLDNEQSDATEPEPTLIQEGRDDIQSDGTIIFISPSSIVNNGTGMLTERHFINSDFVNLTSMTDEQGNPVEFTATHEGTIYRYHVVFDPPIMPGETFVYYSKGTKTGLIKPVAGKENTYRYYMNHSPNAGQPVLRIEEYLLPEGAEVVSIYSDDMTQSEQDGRILLRVEKVIPTGGSILTSFQYKLDQ